MGRADDIIAEAPEPELAVEELARDATTVQDAAADEARDAVNTWASQFALWLVKLLAKQAVVGLGKLLWEEVYPLIVLIVFEATLPDPPPPPDLSTTDEPDAVTTNPNLPEEIDDHDEEG